MLTCTLSQLILMQLFETDSLHGINWKLSNFSKSISWGVAMVKASGLYIVSVVKSAVKLFQLFGEEVKKIIFSLVN